MIRIIDDALEMKFVEKFKVQIRIDCVFTWLSRIRFPFNTLWILEVMETSKLN